MTKTANDIVTLALRTIGVTPVDEEPQGDDYAYADAVYAAEFARLKTDQGFTWTWTYDEVPDALYKPMSDLLASSLTAYNRPRPPRAGAVAAIRSHELPDDRDDVADYDEDGTVSDAEAAAFNRTRYF